MGNRRISSDLKDCALELWTVGWDIEDVCFAFRVSPRSLYRWRDIFEEFGQVTKPPSPLRGRDRIVSLAALTAIREVYFKDATVMLDELAWHLAIHHDIAISISALQATLVRAGLTRKVLQKTASERDEVQREEYRGCIRDPAKFSGTGMEFVAVDESSKDERTLSRGYGRSPLGQRAESSEDFVRADRYTLTAAMSTEGYIATRIILGSMDAYEFFDFIVEDVVSRVHSSPLFLRLPLPKLPQMKPYPDVQSVLILDNCRIHHTDLLKEVLNEHGESSRVVSHYSP